MNAHERRRANPIRVLVGLAILWVGAIAVISVAARVGWEIARGAFTLWGWWPL